MLSKAATAATLFWLVLPWPASGGETAPFPTFYDVPVDAYQLGLIKTDDVVDLLITSREKPNRPLETAGYAQIARVLAVLAAPRSFVRLSTASGLLPYAVKKALGDSGRVRLLLRGAGDRLHNTHLGDLSPKGLRAYVLNRVPMEELAAAPTATEFTSLKLKELPNGTTVSGSQIPIDWRGFPLRLAPGQAAPRPGQRVDVTVSYSSGPIKTLSLWKKAPVLNVKLPGFESKRAIVWLALPAGAARVLAYALDGLSPAGVDLAVVAGE